MAIRPAPTSGSGVLLVPDDIGKAGWWTGGSRLGDPYGSIVVAAHVDSFTQGVGQFAELLQIDQGDLVRLTSEDLRQQFRVVWAHLVPKTALADDAAAAFTPVGDGRLVLITCGGAYDPSLGGYQDNMVVIADPVGSPQPLNR
jgi:Sortase domain